MSGLARPGPDDLHFSAAMGSGFPMGRMFTLIAEEGDQIARIRIGVGTIVQALEVTFVDKDGGTHVQHAGMAKPDAWVDCRAHGRLIGVSGRSGWHLDSLSLHWEGGRAEAAGGQGGDTYFHLSAHLKSGVHQAVIAGLWGYEDDEGIESLGLCFWSIEKSWSVAAE